MKDRLNKLAAALHSAADGFERQEMTLRSHHAQRTSKGQMIGMQGQACGVQRKQHAGIVQQSKNLLLRLSRMLLAIAAKANQLQ